MVVITFRIKKKIKLQNTYQKDHKKLSLAVRPLKHYNIINQGPLVSYTKKQSLMGCVSMHRNLHKLHQSQFYPSLIP